MQPLPNIAWIGDADTGHLRLLDQTKLPTEQTYLECTTVQDVWDAIKRLSVRGAPAIGIAAGYGVVIAAQDGPDAVPAACDHLASARPTAVNVFGVLDRMRASSPHTPDALLAVATAIHDEDRAACQAIGQNGLRFIESLPDDRRGVLTHCNAGALATGGIGTATAPMYLAHERGMNFRVFADETRPLLQGSRLTAFELAAAGIDTTLICDDMAAHVMQQGRVGVVITGADRIAANGDTANKIGTYNLAVLAKHHGLPFVIAAPTTTIDPKTATGADIPIEQRDAVEITNAFGKPTAPTHDQLPELGTYNPAFDVTPAELITAIVTERGVVQPVTESRVAEIVVATTVGRQCQHKTSDT
ncbi:MAG: S-methyl-5-thioribose-1-phosphate isomerase [Planctomycetota bacterium]